MTIEELLNSYFQRAAKASGQLDIIERAEAERQPVPKLNITVPNYADEVIRPILKMVAEALPEYEISVRPPSNANWSTDCSRYVPRKFVSAVSRIRPRTTTNSISPRYFIVRPAKDRK